ncbi:unnamed protein product [Paramecium sonneborni]|uniref:Uncharacterized protein n=1 Tax=Paramecium sonneborni TaxID=65129 RepID=A0A8S1M689_9CILI|nr:unnamed protein product [Paramecium sonneborni]
MDQIIRMKQSNEDLLKYQFIQLIQIRLSNHLTQTFQNQYLNFTILIGSSKWN